MWGCVVRCGRRWACTDGMDNGVYGVRDFGRWWLSIGDGGAGAERWGVGAGRLEGAYLCRSLSSYLRSIWRLCGAIIFISLYGATGASYVEIDLDNRCSIWASEIVHVSLPKSVPMRRCVDGRGLEVFAVNLGIVDNSHSYTFIVYI